MNRKAVSCLIGDISGVEMFREVSLSQLEDSSFGSNFILVSICTLVSWSVLQLGDDSGVLRLFGVYGLSLVGL